MYQFSFELTSSEKVDSKGVIESSAVWRKHEKYEVSMITSIVLNNFNNIELQVVNLQFSHIICNMKVDSQPESL